MSVRLCCVSVIGLCYIHTVHFTAFCLRGPFFSRTPGPEKRGFSCPAGRLRLATGRVQTAEWTNGHAVRYLGPTY